jgi:hypothetical protein
MPPKQLTITIKANGFAGLYYIKLKYFDIFPSSFPKIFVIRKVLISERQSFQDFFFSSAYLNHLQRKPVCLNFSFGTNFFLLCSGIMMQWGNIIVGIKFQELELKMHK